MVAQADSFNSGNKSNNPLKYNIKYNNCPGRQSAENRRNLSYDTAVYQTNFETLWLALKPPNWVKYLKGLAAGRRRSGWQLTGLVGAIAPGLQPGAQARTPNQLPAWRAWRKRIKADTVRMDFKLKVSHSSHRIQLSEGNTFYYINIFRYLDFFGFSIFAWPLVWILII